MPLNTEEIYRSFESAKQPQVPNIPDIDEIYGSMDSVIAGRPKTEFVGGLKAIGRQLLTLPEETISAGLSALQGQSGVDLADPDIIDKAQGWFEKRRNEREMKESETLGNNQIIPGVKTTDLTSGLGQSLAFSGVTAGTGVGTGLVIGGVAGTGVALGTAYRMASNQVMRQYLNHMNDAKIKEKGQSLTNDEEEALKAEFSDRATKYGIWEAVPEVAGGLIGLKVLTTPLKKMIGKNVLVKGLAKAAGVVLPEIGEETATQIGQSQTLAGTPLQEGKVLDFNVPGVVEAVKQVAPQTVLISALMGGVGGVAVNKYNAKKASLLKEMVNKEQGHKLLDDEKLNNVYKNFADIVESRPNDKELQSAYANILGEIERRKEPVVEKELPKAKVVAQPTKTEVKVEPEEEAVAEAPVAEKPLARDVIARMQNQRLMNIEAAKEKYGLQPTTVTAPLELELRTAFRNNIAEIAKQEVAQPEAARVVSGLTPADIRGIEDTIFKEWNKKAKDAQYSEPYLRELYLGLEDNAFKLFAQKAAQTDYTNTKSPLVVDSEQPAQKTPSETPPSVASAETQEASGQVSVPDRTVQGEVKPVAEDVKSEAKESFKTTIDPKNYKTSNEFIEAVVNEQYDGKPSREVKFLDEIDNQEGLLTAAVIANDKIYTGRTHGVAIQKAVDAKDAIYDEISNKFIYTDGSGGRVADQLFITDSGYLVDRATASAGREDFASGEYITRGVPSLTTEKSIRKNLNVVWEKSNKSEVPKSKEPNILQGEAETGSEIFIREIKKSEKGNPTRSLQDIPDKEGYDKVYKPYGTEGKGFYYVEKPATLTAPKTRKAASPDAPTTEIISKEGKDKGEIKVAKQTFKEFLKSKQINQNIGNEASQYYNSVRHKELLAEWKGQKKASPKAEKVIEPTKQEEAKITTPKAQKKYLLDAIDDAMGSASKESPETFEQKFPTTKEAQAQWVKDKQKVVDSNKKNFGTVTIEVPNDGTFEILNTKQSLTEFKKQAQKFPVTAEKAVRQPTEIKPSGKRIQSEEVQYYNTFKPRKQGLIEGAEKANNEKANYYIEGWFTNGEYGLITEKPKMKLYSTKGKIKDILPKDSELEPIEFIGEFSHGYGYGETPSVHAITKSGMDIVYSARYIDSILTEHPNAKAYSAGETRPLVFKDKGKPVGIIMPRIDKEFMEKFGDRIAEITGKPLAESAPKEDTKTEYSQSEGDTNNGLSMFQRRNGSYPTTESGAIRYFEESLAERIGKSVPTGTIREVEATTKEQKVIKAIGKSFGLKVVFLKSTKEYPLFFNGVVIPEIQNTIFLSVDPIGGNMLSVAGHETLHVLKNSNPELYNFLAEQLSKTSVGFKEYQEKMAAKYKKFGINAPDTANMFTEFLGDFAGDQFTNKDFWNKLYGKSPTLTQKLIETVKRIVDKMLNIARNFKSENYFTDVKKAQDVLAEVMGEFSKRQKAGGKAEVAETQYSLASPEAYWNETKEWTNAMRKAWSSRGMYQKNPGLISKAFNFVFGSPEWSSHPVMQALSDTFIERSAWFNENFKKFVEGDHPESKFDTMNEALDSLNEEQMDKFAELDNQFDTSGFTQNEARAYMEKNNIDPAIREVWEAKTARMNTVWDAHMAPIEREINEIDARAMTFRKDPVYPVVSYEIKYVKDSKGNENPQFDKEKPITIKDVLEMMREIKTYAYSPRLREQGAYAVRGFKSAEGREFMRFEKNLVAAEKLKAELIKDGWGKVYIAESNTFPESVLAGLKEMDVAKLIQAASDKNDKEAVSEVFTKEISDVVHQIILARGYRRHTIARQDKLVEGYETDPRKKMFTYFTNSAAGLAKSKAARQVMDIMLGGINEGSPEGYRIANILGEYHKNPIKANEEARLYDTAKKYISDNLRNIDEADKMIATVKKLATFKYLSWTLRAPLVNTTALLTTVLPSIHQYCSNGEKQTKQSFTKIIKEIGIAGGQYAKIMASQKNKGIKAPDLAYDEQAFIDDINRSEYDDPQMVRDMMTSMQASSGKMFDNIVQWGMIPFKATEQWMRGLTMLAGYRIAKANGLSTVQAQQAAIKAAGNAHGIYGKATRQYWAQGTDPAARIGQIATTFLKFPQNYLNLLYDLGWDKGNIKAFTWALAAPVVLGGAVAIPFYSNVVWMINAIMKALGDDRDIEKMVYDDARLYLGKEAEKNIRTGLMGAAGIDVTGSLSMGIGLPTDLLSLTGIFGAMAKETTRAGHFISTKQYSKALETALPSGVANLFRAVRELDGATTSTGARVWNENGTPYIPDVSETTLRILGFRSSERTTTQQRQWESQREEQRFGETRNKIYERYRAYLSKGKPSPKEQKEILNSIYVYNKAVYDSGRAGLVPFIGRGQLTRQARAMVVPSKKERMRMIPLEEKED